MKRTAPYWETPLDLFKLLVTGLGLVLLLGMLRGCVPGGPETAAPAGDVPAAEFGIEAPGLDLDAIPEADLAQVAEGGYELGGVALPGSEVEIFDGDVSLGMAKAGPDGRWAFALPALAAGAHALRLVGPDMTGEPFELSLPAFSLSGAAADAGGETDVEEAEAAGEAVDEDAEGDAGEEAAGEEAANPAVAPAIDPSDLGTSFAAADLSNFAGTAAPGATVMIYDGDTLLGTTTADNDGAWTFALTEPLGPGDHALMAVVAGRDEEQSSDVWAFAITADDAQAEAAVGDEGSATAGEADDGESEQDEAGAESEESGREQPATLPSTGRAPLQP